MDRTKGEGDLEIIKEVVEDTMLIMLAFNRIHGDSSQNNNSHGNSVASNQSTSHSSASQMNQTPSLTPQQYQQLMNLLKSTVNQSQNKPSQPSEAQFANTQSGSLEWQYQGDW